ncbi:hypothetical protein [Aquimarina sp. RZ0]|nr:hypothetical protein [Aquimarina sp. RZ0]
MNLYEFFNHKSYNNRFYTSSILRILAQRVQITMSIFKSLTGITQEV